MRPQALTPMLLVVVAGCSTSNNGSPASLDDLGSVCRGELPAKLSLSEGGRMRFNRKAGETYQGAGGVTIIEDEGTVTIRAPYITEANGDVTLQLGCGASIPIELRPLSWTKLAEWGDGQGADAREYGASWIDPEGAGALVVFGGFHYAPKQFTPANDAWRFDFGTSSWTTLAGADLPMRPGARVAPIPDERAVLLFGGTIKTEDGSLNAPPSLTRLDYDDKSLTPRAVQPLGDIPESYTGSFVFDSKRSRWLSACGWSSDSGYDCEVYAYTISGGFVRVETANKPAGARYGFHYAYDEVTDRLVIFGGQIGSSNSATSAETWVLDFTVDPPQWTKLKPAGPEPMKRRNGAFALDTMGHRLFVWGGTADGQKTVPGLQVLSLDRGAETWTDIAVPEEVPPRTSAIGVHDAARDRVLWGFGNDRAPLQDLWSLDTANVAPR